MRVEQKYIHLNSDNADPKTVPMVIVGGIFHEPMMFYDFAKMVGDQQERAGLPVTPMLLYVPIGARSGCTQPDDMVKVAADLAQFISTPIPIPGSDWDCYPMGTGDGVSRCCALGYSSGVDDLVAAMEYQRRQGGTQVSFLYAFDHPRPDSHLHNMVAFEKILKVLLGELSELHDNIRRSLPQIILDEFAALLPLSVFVSEGVGSPTRPLIEDVLKQKLEGTAAGYSPGRDTRKVFARLIKRIDTLGDYLYQVPESAEKQSIVPLLRALKKKTQDTMARLVAYSYWVKKDITGFSACDKAYGVVGAKGTSDPDSFGNVAVYFTGNASRIQELSDEHVDSPSLKVVLQKDSEATGNFSDSSFNLVFVRTVFGDPAAEDAHTTLFTEAALSATFRKIRCYVPTHKFDPDLNELIITDESPSRVHLFVSDLFEGLRGSGGAGFSIDILRRLREADPLLSITDFLKILLADGVIGNNSVFAAGSASVIPLSVSLFTPPQSARFDALLAQAQKKIPEENKVQLVFTTERAAKEMQTQLLSADKRVSASVEQFEIETITVIDEGASAAPTAEAYAIRLTKEEYNAVMGRKNAYGDLLESLSHIGVTTFGP